MTRFLMFTVYAPLASWGEPAVGEIRGSWDRPSRSAMLGLAAAALGVVREDDAGHAALDSSLGIAIRLLAPGEPLIDFHTTQNPKSNIAKKRKPETRRIALALDEPTTTLSRRWLRQDALYRVALWARPDASVGLDTIANALRSPSFTLYAGRKANALGLPLAPSVIEADSLGEALRDEPMLPGDFALLQPKAGWGTEIMYDPCDGFEAGLTPVHLLTRRDATPVRSRWQFTDRIVHVGRLPQGQSA